MTETAFSKVVSLGLIIDSQILTLVSIVHLFIYSYAISCIPEVDWKADLMSWAA